MSQTESIQRIRNVGTNTLVDTIVYSSLDNSETPTTYTFPTVTVSKYGLAEILDGLGSSAGGSATFAGGTISDNTTLVSNTVSKTLRLQSSPSGGLGTSTSDTDTTSHLVLESYQTNGPSGGTNSGFFGEPLRIALKSNLAKGMISWTLLRNSSNTPDTKSAYYGLDRSVVWTGAHYYAQDQPDPNNPTVVHGHHSFAEIPDANDALQTRFEINFIDKSTGKVGVDRANIMTNFADFTFRAGTSAKGTVGDAGVFRISGGGTYNRDIEWNINDDPQVSGPNGMRWRLRVDNTTEGYNGTGSGADFRLMRRYSPDNDNNVTVLFAERLTGNVLIGNSALTDTSTNQGRLNIHWAGGSTNGISLTPTASLGGSSAHLKIMGQSAGTEVVLESRLVADTVARFKQTIDGVMNWGPGGAAGRDTNLYRAAADTLKTDDSLIVSGTLSGGVKTGLAKISGGAIQWGIPNTTFNAQNTTTVAAGSVRYLPVIVRYPITVTAQQFEVTTAPASAANVAIGIYAADSNMQPVGAPLYDSGSIPVASGFTGLKTTTGLSVVLPAGTYLYAVNADTALSLRSFASPTPIIFSTLGAAALVQRFDATQTFGAYPNPGTQWTSANAVTGGLQHVVVFQWTE